MKQSTPGLWDDESLPSVRATEINRQRQGTYGDPAPNMVVLAKLWSICFEVEISPQQAAMGCIMLKQMREMQSGYDPDYPDNLDDICGFTNVLYKAKEASRGPKPTTT